MKGEAIVNSKVFHYIIYNIYYVHVNIALFWAGEGRCGGHVFPYAWYLQVRFLL
jgi:hypothetical protein